MSQAHCAWTYTSVRYGLLAGIGKPELGPFFHMTLFEQLCTYDNLKLAEEKARKGKTAKPYVVAFEERLEANLLQLQRELENGTYRPLPLAIFIIRDPKTRKISKSDFRDRIVHHAICNIIEPLFDNGFIHDNHANRKGKGTLTAVRRYEQFQRQASKNGSRACFTLKADIRHYFDTVDHGILMAILQRRIADRRMLSLIRIILENHRSAAPASPSGPRF